MEVDHQIEARRPQLVQEGSELTPDLVDAPTPQGCAQARAGKDEHVVEPGLRAQQARRGRLDEPGQVSAWIRLAQERGGRKRAHDVPHRPQSHDQDALRGRGALHRVANDDAEPRKGVGSPLGYSSMRAARIPERPRAWWSG